MKLPFVSSKEKPQTPSRPVSLRSQLLLLAAAGAVLIVLPASITSIQEASRLDAVEHRQSALAANLLASVVDQWVLGVRASAELIAKDPDLNKLMDAGSETELSARAGQLGRMIPTSMAVRLLAAGVQQIDTHASPPLSYAALDMLRYAESGSAPPMEVHLSGTARQHIAVVESIADPAGRTTGHLMISFPLAPVQDALLGPQLEGYAELQQVVAGTPVVLGSRGPASLKRGPAHSQAMVPDTRWRVAYWMPQDPRRSFRTAASVAAVAALLLALMVWLIYRRTRLALGQDQSTMLAITADMRSGQVKATYPAKLAEMRDGIDAMARAAAAGPGQGGPHTLAGADAPPSAASAPGKDTESDLLFDDSALDIRGVEVQQLQIDESIFRAYDIRGIVGASLTQEAAFEIGRAVGSEAYERGEQTVVVGRDGRVSGPELARALIRGLEASGRDVKDVGQVPTPVLYFAAQQFDTSSGVMVTGSHNPVDYNGFKVVLAGETLAGAGIQALRQRIEHGEMLSGRGSVERVEALSAYQERILADVQVARPLKLVVDCGNGVAGAVAPRLLRSLGCEVIELYCDVDGTFPNHHPDPSRPENLSDLVKAVQANGAELGIAFDGDGDRIGVVGSQGEIIWPDRILMLFAMDVLLRNPGARVIYDVKCSRHVAAVVTQFGGEPLMCATGHSLIKAKMKQTGALLAGEMSGHLFFKERWLGFDDGIYAAARLVELLGNDQRTSTEVFAALPDSVNTPELTVPMAEGEPERFMARLAMSAIFEDATVIKLDGMRIEFQEGWGLIRASNTTPSLVLRFEADDQSALSRIQDRFRQAMLDIDATLSLPF